MSEKALTHKNLSVLLGVSETTVKSYRRKFPGSIPVANKGKPIRFKPEATEICLRIRDLFAEGMSVEEVGARLTQEFGWRRPRSAEPAARQIQRKSGNSVDLSQSFATALGNMAKSMISLNQSHTGILNTLKKVETMLGEIGLGGFKIDAESIVDARRKNEATAAEAFSDIARTMDQVAVTMELAGNTLKESRELHRERARENAVIIETLESVLGAVRDISGQPAGSASSEKSKVVYLYQDKARKLATSSGPSSDASPDFSEAPRRLLQLPLVIRLENGTYISAGGKNLGKITLNDVKAMLAQTYLPPENFQLRWERDPEGIWAVLEQHEGLSMRLLMSEIVSAKGTSVLEVSAFKENDASRHPVDFYRFLGEIGR